MNFREADVMQVHSSYRLVNDINFSVLSRNDKVLIFSILNIKLFHRAFSRNFAGKLALLFRSIAYIIVEPAGGLVCVDLLLSLMTIQMHFNSGNSRL